MSSRTRIVLLTLAAASPAAAGEDPAVAAARERERLVRTARFEVHVRELYAKGFISRSSDQPVPDPLPAEDITVDADDVLVLDGDKARVEMTVPVWSGLRFRRVPLVAVWDGTRGRTFYPDGFGPSGRPTGAVNDVPTGRWATIPLWSALTLTVRGLSPDLSHDPISRLAATDRTEVIDGHACREYTAGPRPDPPARFWLDPGAGHVVRRVRWPGAGRTTNQLAVRFCPDETAGWLPAGWTWTYADADGQVLRTLTATVTAARLNGPVPADQFELTFPPGAFVTDQRTGQDYRVEPDGTWREVDPAAELRGGAPPPAGPEVSWRRARVAGVGLAVGLAALFAVWLRLRRPPRRGGGG